MIAALSVENLACRRGSRRLFENLGFTLKAGEVLAVEGANGAGKTSLLRLIAGFLVPAAGLVRLDDVSDPEQRGRLVGWLGHHDALKGSFTAAEQLAFYARLYGGTTDIGGALERVGLARQGELACRYLSAGQKRRLALARLLVSHRPLWLLDEPFAALDTAGKALAAQLMREHCGVGGMVLAATHEPLGLANASLKL
jgi:heme exporter protein A